jgi:hypothetical protein
MKRRPAAIAALIAGALATAGSARADSPPSVPAPATTPAVSTAIAIWPTMTPAGDDPGGLPLHKPAESEWRTAARAQELDATLRDGAQDLGFTLEIGDRGPVTGRTRDTDILEAAARGAWVVSPRIEHGMGDSFIVRMVVVPPNGRELRVRVETIKGVDVSVRGLVMLRDLLSPTTAAQAAASEKEREKVDPSAGLGIMSPTHSPGRAVLAVNGAAFGAFVAYSIQRASGNDDPRVLYPLLALGTGIGIGSTLLASEEWDVSTGDAWFLSAGAWWSAAAGLFIANGRHVQPLTDRYAWGVGAGLTGLGLATFALTRSKMNEGDAVLAHSGGGLGMSLGGLTELAYRGKTTGVTPYTGAGYGAAIGLVGAGALATFVDVSPSRVLLVDMGAGLGALAGAAAASPLVLFLTRNAPAAKTATWHYGTPVAGVIGSSATPTGPLPAYGAGWQGTF